MPPFPVDAPERRVVSAFAAMGFAIVREREHIAMVRENPDGSRALLTMPNHRTIEGSTLQTICSQAGIDREEVLDAYNL